MAVAVQGRTQALLVGAAYSLGGEVKQGMWNELMARITTAVMGVKDEDGQTMIEYALLAVFISIVAIIALTAIGVDVKAIFEKVDSATNGPAATP